ncbi:MAG: hypothetical protein AAGI15_10440, partial [Pseudomonadota bacterium]
GRPFLLSGEVMLTRINLSAGAVLLALLGASPGVAAELTATTADLVVKRIYMQLDCDLDGAVEPDEVDEHFAQVWAPMDRDGSRTLSSTEYWQLLGSAVSTQPVAADARVQQLFGDADADANQAIDPAEMRAHLRRLIVLADRNGDYEVTRPEVGLAPWPKAHNRRPVSGTSAGPRAIADH